MERKLLLGATALLGAGIVTIGAMAAGPATADKSSAPAMHGGAAETYAMHCAACHGPDLGGPIGPNTGVPLRGPAFVARWSGSPAALLAFTQKTMPLNDPGSLDTATYAQIVNFVRSANKMPAAAEAPGSPEATAALMAHMALEMSEPVEARDKEYLAVRDRLTALAARITPVSDAMLRNPPDGDWIAWRRSQGTSGFSPLKQIDRGNVGQLGLAWSLSLGNGTNGFAPLVHDGVMFFNSNGTVRALDATNGDLIWEHAHPATSSRVPMSQSRGIALYRDSVIVPTIDNHVLSLDARTGKLRWDHLIGKPEDKVQLTAAPLIANGKVIQGVSGCQGAELAGGCYIVALDAATGKEQWRFYTIARPGQAGGDSWNGAPLEQRFGGSVWTAGSYDPDLNLVYFGTGQTYIVSTLLKGAGPKTGTRDALYTDTTLALNPDTGKLVWHYQHSAGDVWDLDWAFERTLATVPGPSGPRKIVVTAGKTAIIEALDARTGEYLWSYDMGLQNVITAIDPRTGRKTYDSSLTPEPGKLKLVCPSSIGARNWISSAYDPGTGILYFPMFETCGGFGLARDDASNPSYSNFGEFAQEWRARPGTNGNYGRIAAIDLKTGRPVWINRYRAPPISALLTTAGGVVFGGGRDRWFRALDSASGATLWQTRLANVPNGFPLSYMVGGRQFVAVVSGGGSALDLFLKSYTPENPDIGPSKTLMVFALPQKLQH